MTVDLTSLTLFHMDTSATPNATIERPRKWWASTTDADLIVARDEYREKAPTFDADLAAELLEIADDIDDDLARRVEWRKALAR